MMPVTARDLFPFDDDWRGIVTRRTHLTTYLLTRNDR